MEVKYVNDYTVQQVWKAVQRGNASYLIKLKTNKLNHFSIVKDGLTSTNLHHHHSVSLKQWDSLCLKSNSHSFFEPLIIEVCSLHWHIIVCFQAGQDVTAKPNSMSVPRVHARTEVSAVTSLTSSNVIVREAFLANSVKRTSTSACHILVSMVGLVMT